MDKLKKSITVLMSSKINHFKLLYILTCVWCAAHILDVMSLI